MWCIDLKLGIEEQVEHVQRCKAGETGPGDFEG